MSLVKAAAAFPRFEFLRRLQETRTRMEAANVDVLLVSNPSNIVYLTGYTAPTAYVPQLLMVNLGQEEPDLYLRQMDRPAGLHLAFMGDDRIHAYPEDCIGNPGMNAYDNMLDRMADRLEGKRIGLEFANLPFYTAGILTTRLGEDRVADCSMLVDTVRLVKSDLEIALMRRVAQVSEMTIMRATEVIRAGVRECDVAAELTSVQIRGLPDLGSVSLALPFISSTPRTGSPHFHWTDDVYKPGTQVTLEAGGSLHRYCVGIKRSFHVGRPEDRMVRAHAAKVEALAAVLATGRPGATCADMAEAAYAVIGRHGFEKASRCGYGIGIDWLEPVVSISRHDHTVLQPNMTFHLVLSNWIGDDFGYAFSETLRITETGVETMTNAPREFFAC